MLRRKNLEKWTYTQSYPHFPQKRLNFPLKKSRKNRKFVLANLLKKFFFLKYVDKSNVEKGRKI
jgi:hypothetical protein